MSINLYPDNSLPHINNLLNPSTLEKRGVGGMLWWEITTQKRGADSHTGPLTPSPITGAWLRVIRLLWSQRTRTAAWNVLERCQLNSRLSEFLLTTVSTAVPKRLWWNFYICITGDWSWNNKRRARLLPQSYHFLIEIGKKWKDHWRSAFATRHKLLTESPPSNFGLSTSQTKFNLAMAWVNTSSNFFFFSVPRG